MKKKNEISRRTRNDETQRVIELPKSSVLTDLPENYPEFIQNIKNTIAKARHKAILSANSEMTLLYWEIGRAILEQQNNYGWGAKVIERMSYDLQNEFKGLSGFSSRNLQYMRKFAEAYSDFEIVQRTVAQIPWRTNIALLDKLNDYNLRIWYAQKVLSEGYSRDVLVYQIESGLHKREGATLNNFPVSLPQADSDLTAQLFKDPYIFDFIGTGEIKRESELEEKLTTHIQNFLLELGQGFAFVGRQVHLELGERDFYIDLLFYHLKLRCYIIVELKTGDFQPEYIGKLNMYLNIVNAQLRHSDDNMSIGLLLVKSKDKVIVEYSLTGYTNPISIANWELPEQLKTSLPTIEEIEKELER